MDEEQIKSFVQTNSEISLMDFYKSLERQQREAGYSMQKTSLILSLIHIYMCIRDSVYSLMNRCDLYFKKMVCTYDMWIVNTRLYGESSFCLVYTIYTMNNNHLDKKDSIVAYLEHEDDTYVLDFKEYKMTVCEERKRQRDHDMEVGRFILQCYVDLLNDLLQEVEI